MKARLPQGYGKQNVNQLMQQAQKVQEIMKEKQALSTKVYNAALDGLAETAEDTSDEGLARAFEEMYETWKNEYTVTTDPIWDNIVIGSVG